jgi:hypothetical protein
MLHSVAGGFSFEPAEERLLREQRALTFTVNNNFVQVGAVFLKTSGKTPFEQDWFKRGYRDTNLQSWIDDPEHQLLNVGFNLQFGWVDIDIDSSNAEYNRCIIAGLNHLGVDTRFQFGRLSVGAPSHLLIQLNEAEATNFNQLKQFEPNEFRVGGVRHKVELRSLATSTQQANLVREAKQTVMPGSIYVNKINASTYDISVWYHNGSNVAHSISDIASTTPHKTSFNTVIRAIAFGTALYLFQPHWVEGSRQIIAQKISGWLARVVAESCGLNNHEAIADDVFCPVDSDGIAESLIEFVCKELGDNEPYMRVRTYRDACAKIARNPDAKIPGWPTMSQLFGDDVVNALRTVLMPGADVSILTKLAERYIYDETDDLYIDRERFQAFTQFAHSGAELDRRHRGDFVRVGGKLRPAFKLFEISTIRKRVNTRDLYPELTPGGIFRIDRIGEQISDDSEEERITNTAFNTWKGWPIAIANPVDPNLMQICISHLDQLFSYLTRDNEKQSTWLKQWLAWVVQHPGVKQQVAPVIVGGQGVGKSFFGNTFLQALFQNLWGTASPKLLEGGFAIEPFIGKMLVFIDEAKFHSEASTEEIKKLIRNVNIGGAEKFQSARNYRIFSRVVFASNYIDMNLGQANIQDRALFYMKAYDKEHMNMSAAAFRQWAVTLKPFFDRFNELLSRKDVREHFMHYFAHYDTDRHAIENTENSAATDNDIVSSNMSYARRVAKFIVEDGRIVEDSDISMPFNVSDINKRVTEVCKDMGIMPVQGARVLAEFREAGLIEPHVENGRNMMRFKYKIATLTEKFGLTISATMEPRFQFTEDDSGDNNTTLASPKGWKGLNQRLFRRV